MGHDQLFKELLRAFFAGFLRLAVPALARRLDVARVTYLDKEAFTDWPEGRRRELDLLARVPILGDAGDAVLVHVEIEASAQKETSRRLWQYSMQLNLRYGCPVLPIVVYLKGGPVGLAPEMLSSEVLGWECATFRHVSFGLARSRAEEYLEKPEPLAWALSALMRRGRMRRAEHKLACLRRIAAAELGELERFLLANCVETYLQLTPDEAAEYDALRAGEENRTVRAMQRTWAEKMEAEYRKSGLREGRLEGRREGLREGRREGRQEGAREGARRVLLRLLARRFGPLPDATRARVAAIDSVARLTRLAERVLIVETLEELGL